MANTNEILAKLGIDASSVPKDLASAKAFFDKFAAELKASGGDAGAKAGGTLGESFVKGFTKNLEAKDAFKGLATAIGLNVEKISQIIVEGIMGGSVEGWRRFAEESDRVTDLVLERTRSRVGPETVLKQLKSDIGAVEARLAEFDKRTSGRSDISSAGSFVESLKARFIGVKNRELTSDELAERKGLVRELEEAQKRVDDQSKKVRDEGRKDRAEQLDDANEFEDHLTKQTRLRKEIANLTKEANAKDISYDERQKILEDIRKREKDIREDQIAYGKEGLQIEEEINDEYKARRDLQNQIADKQREINKQSEKLKDNTKLTLGELANIKPSKNSIEKSADEVEQHMREIDEDSAFGGGAGLSSKQLELRKKARQVQALEAKAEEARLAGDSTTAESILGQAGSMRNELVKSGALKTSEAAQNTESLKDIEKNTRDLGVLIENLNKIVSGKFVSQPSSGSTNATGASSK